MERSRSSLGLRSHFRVFPSCTAVWSRTGGLSGRVPTPITQKPALARERAQVVPAATGGPGGPAGCGTTRNHPGSSWKAAGSGYATEEPGSWEKEV
ncbi:hypothetical protein NDU88_005855 [Pleurodeles waltl]|uniref:Uncharacterized protein n=1 Tax=Pleurodeles waltl TaxID=8319 RepID=A0AAV7MDB6_PLEWA|nr:hypothetical protein NDU88_005855 [Pleurodeles waltl]